MKRKRKRGATIINASEEILRLANKEDEEILSLTLTDLPRELVASVLSFIHFYERSVVRRVCRRLLGAVDSMPALPESTLEVEVTSTSPEEEDQVHAPTVEMIYLISSSKVYLDIDLNGQDIQQALPLIPPLGSIRPTRLHVESESPGGLDALLVRHLAADVGSTVTSLSIEGLKSGSPVELQKAFSEFQKQGDNVTELELDGCRCPLAHILSAATFLRGLTRLDLGVTEEMILGWESQPNQIGLHFAVLATLPHLRDLAVRGWDGGRHISYDKNAVASMALGLSAITQLHRVATNLLFHQSEETGEAIAMMLSRLKNLNEMSHISFPDEEIFRPLSLIGGNTQIRKLFVQHSWASTRVLDCLVSLAFNRSFPALTELTINFLCQNEERPSFLEMVPKFAGLMVHPLLSTVKMSFFQVHDTERSVFLERFREAVGQRINVIEIED